MLAAPWLAVLTRECHKVWLPPSAKGTDLLPALRTNPFSEVSPGTGYEREKKKGGGGGAGPKSELEKQKQPGYGLWRKGPT